MHPFSLVLLFSLRMTKTKTQQLLVFLFLLSQILLACLGDVGTAARYSPPYLPTQCDGEDSSQFPSSNLFAAAGEGIWDNGASCGRQYLVRCISASQPRTCIPDRTIQIRIVDYAQAATVQATVSAPAATIVLSKTAFEVITNSSSKANAINIEFQQV